MSLPTKALFVVATTAFALVVGCSDDSSTDTSVADCGDGEAMEIEDTRLCVYEQEVVVETGFNCPAHVENRIEHGEFLICSERPESEVPETILEQAEREYRQRRNLDDEDAGVPDTACTDNDADGFCATDDCDDNNPAVNPSAPELGNGLDDDCDGTIDEDVACAADSDCQVNQLCSDGFCVGMCQADSECAADQLCEAGVCVTQ